MVKSDDVRRGGILKKIPVNGRNLRVGNEGGLNGGQVGQRGERTGYGEAFGDRHVHDASDP